MKASLPPSSHAVFHEVGTRATVYGDLGKLVLPDPWIPQGQRQASANSFEVLRYGMAPELIRIDPGKPVYALEAELFADTLSPTSSRHGPP